MSKESQSGNKKSPELRKAERKVFWSTARLTGKGALTLFGFGAAGLQIKAIESISGAKDSMQTGWDVTRAYQSKIKEASDQAITSGLDTIHFWTQTGYVSAGALALLSLGAGIATLKEGMRYSSLAHNVEQLTPNATAMPASLDAFMHADTH